MATSKPKKYTITWPFRPKHAEDIDDMFDDLYKRLSFALTGASPGAGGFTAGDLLYFTGLVTAGLPDVATGSVLLSGGVGIAPFYGQVDLTTTVTGILPVTNGGTGTATAFTLGSVVFAGASGVYTQDNSNFFWDNTNDRLGIGTNTPSAGLHIIKTFSTDQAVGLYADIFHTTATAGTVYGGRYDATISHSSGTMNNVVGLINSARYAGTGTAATSSMTGQQSFICLDDVVSPVGTITTVQSLNLSQISNFASGSPAVTISQARGLIIGNIGAGHGSNGLTVTNSSAISIAGSQTAGTNSSVFSISDTTSVPFAGTGTWMFYNASTRNSYWAGPLYMGHTTTWGSGTNFISFADGTVPGTPASNTAAIYSNDVSGTVKMFLIDEAGNTGRIPMADDDRASAASRLLGRGSASGAGNWQEIIIGTGLTMTGTTLEASASGDHPDWDVLTNGDAGSPEIIFADGEVIMVETP